MKIQNGVLVSYTGQEEHLIIPREVTEIAAYAKAQGFGFEAI